MTKAELEVDAVEVCRVGSCSRHPLGRGCGACFCVIDGGCTDDGGLQGLGAGWGAVLCRCVAWQIIHYTGGVAVVLLCLHLCLHQTVQQAEQVEQLPINFTHRCQHHHTGGR